MTLARRLDRLHAAWPHAGARLSPALDFAALTPEECGELDTILATLEGAPRRPNGRPDLAPLSDAELERLAALVERITEKEPA